MGSLKNCIDLAVQRRSKADGKPFLSAEEAASLRKRLEEAYASQKPYADDAKTASVFAVEGEMAEVGRYLNAVTKALTPRVAALEQAVLNLAANQAAQHEVLVQIAKKLGVDGL